MQKLFVYGSLIEPKYQHEALGRLLTLEPYVLHEFTKDSIKLEGEEWFIAVPKEGASIKGYVTEVTDNELCILDEWEGERYKRAVAGEVYFYRNAY